MVIMEHSYSKINNEINPNDGGLLFGEDELELVDILLDLPYLITNSLSTYRFPYNWGTKKLRSVLVSPPPPPLSFRRKVTPPPPPKLAMKVEASSPNTPLSFSPSESDSKPPIPPPLPTKRKAANGLYSRKRELEETIRERLLTQQQLKESIEKVKEYYNEVLAENLEWKGKKQKFLQLLLTASTPTQMEHQQQTTIATPAVNDRVYAVPSTSAESHRPAPLILHPHQQISANDWVHAGPTQFLFHHHGQPQPAIVNDQLYASPLRHHQAPSINPPHHRGQPQPAVVNDPVYAGPLRHHQAPPLINPHHHHGQPIPGMVNDQVRAGPLSSMQLHYPQPLIPNQQFGILINQAERYDQGCGLDLNLLPPDNEYRANTAEARKRRLQVHKEKKTRAPTKPLNAK